MLYTIQPSFRGGTVRKASANKRLLRSLLFLVFFCQFIVWAFTSTHCNNTSTIETHSSYINSDRLKSNSHRIKGMFNTNTSDEPVHREGPLYRCLTFTTEAPLVRAEMRFCLQTRGQVIHHTTRTSTKPRASMLTSEENASGIYVFGSYSSWYVCIWHRCRWPGLNC